MKNIWAKNSGRLSIKDEITPEIFALYFCLIFFAMLVPCFSSSYSLNNASINVNRRTEIIQKKVIYDIPSKIILTKFGINLTITTGYFDSIKNNWNISDDVIAYYVSDSAEANNQGGDTVIYGHNNHQVFGSLSELILGDIMKIKTVNGYTFSYKYTSDKLVDPSDTSVLYDKSNNPRLVLLTCNGLLSNKRRVMYFDFVSVDSPI